MLKFLTGLTEHLMAFILQPIDFAHLRDKPLDNGISVDGTQLGRPDVRVLILYTRSATQARKLIKEKWKRNIVPKKGSLLTFSGQFEQQRLIGIILTEPNLIRFEQKRLSQIEIFDDPRFEIPNFKLMVTYSDSERQSVMFMRELGVNFDKFSTDPNLRPLWERYREEALEYTLRMARFAGREIPADEPFKFGYEKPESKGMSESAILATRGQDLAYFAAHPNETEYYRPLVPGEFPSAVTAEWVKVIQVPESEAPKGESVRVKIPMNRVGGEFVEFRGKKEE